MVASSASDTDADGGRGAGVASSERVSQRVADVDGVGRASAFASERSALVTSVVALALLFAWF